MVELMCWKSEMYFLKNYGRGKGLTNNDEPGDHKVRAGFRQAHTKRLKGAHGEKRNEKDCDWLRRKT